jgi:hypothetical protein
MSNEKRPEKNPFVAAPEDVESLRFDITSTTEAAITPTPVTVEPSSDENKDLQTDYNYIRTNLYAITERSVDALNNLVQIAEQSQHPRAYEVVALLVNTIASAQKDLMSIHREKAKIHGISAKNSPEVVNNNLFVGSTSELDEIIKKMTQKKIEGDE